MNRKMEDADGSYDRLLKERTHLRREHQKIKQEVDSLKSLLGDEGRYSHEASEQKLRLESISIFQDTEDIEHACPLCNSTLENHIPLVTHIQSSLNGLEGQLDAVDRKVPHIQIAVNALEERLSESRDSLIANKNNIDALQASNERLSAMRDYASQRAHVIGRISLLLESLPEIADTSELESEIATNEKEIKLLEDYLNKESIQEKVESTLFLIGKKMTDWASQLQLEHASNPHRLDIRKLTVIADTVDDVPVRC